MLDTEGKEAAHRLARQAESAPAPLCACHNIPAQSIHRVACGNALFTQGGNPCHRIIGAKDHAEHALALLLEMSAQHIPVRSLAGGAEQLNIGTAEPIENIRRAHAGMNALPRRGAAKNLIVGFLRLIEIADRDDEMVNTRE